MPCTNVDIFREKGAKSCTKIATEFYKKMVKKNHSRLLCCNLIQNYVTLTRTSILASSQMAFTNLEKIDMVLMYGEARGHSELARQIYSERWVSSKDIFLCTNRSKRCAASSRFRAF
jgi:hypothetical protein